MFLQQRRICNDIANMKVLMFSTDYRIAILGSKEHERMSQYAGIVEELHIIVFTQDFQGLENSTSANLFIYPTKSNSKWFYGKDGIKIVKRLKKRGISLVTAQDAFETGLAAYKAAKKLNASLQLQMHTDWFSKFYREESFKNKIRIAIANFLVPRANGIRVVSMRLKESLIRGFKLKSEPVVLPIHLDIPVAMLSGKRDLLRIKYPQFGTIAVMVCRLEREKNIFMALNALRNVIKKYPGTGFVIVGDGSMRSKLEETVAEFGLGEEVFFEGWQDNAIPYFLSADLFLNTSNYEGYGRTLIEAGAAGCPLVTTNVGVVGEVFTNDNALISEPQDLNQFEKNLDFALSHKSEMKLLAEKAREAVTHYMSYTEHDRLLILKRSFEASLNPL